MTISDTAERCFLGSMLREPSVIDEALAIAGPDDCRTDANQKVYRAILAVHGARPVDLVTVADELHLRGWVQDVGYDYLGELLGAAPTAASFVHCGEIVRGASLRRKLGALAAEMTAEVNSPTRSAPDALGEFEGKILGLSQLGTKGRIREIKELVDEAFDRIDARMRGLPPGLLTGLRDLDALIGGLRDGELTLIAARPACGKTAFGLGVCRFLSTRENVPTVFVSLEMNAEVLVELRLLASESMVDGTSIRAAAFSHDEMARLKRGGDSLRRSKLIIDDCPQRKMRDIAANARRLKRSRGIAALVIDYLQLIEPEDSQVPRHEQVAAVSRRLKLLARELNIPVVAMAQLNRAAVGREPLLSDLGESGALERDADNVIMLHADSEPDGDTPVIQCLVRKQRNGPVGRFNVIYNRPFVRFENWGGEQPL